MAADIFELTICKVCDHLIDEHHFLACEGAKGESCENVWVVCVNDNCQCFCLTCEAGHEAPPKPTSSSHARCLDSSMKLHKHRDDRSREDAKDISKYLTPGKAPQGPAYSPRKNEVRKS